MKNVLRLITFGIVISLAVAGAASANVESTELDGTWSGSWTPNGGIRDAMTIELRHDGDKLTGRFLSPSPVNFTKTTFDNKKKSLEIEALDVATGKTYKLKGKVEGTEIKGTATVGPESGEAHLIKWTFVPRIGR